MSASPKRRKQYSINVRVNDWVDVNTDDVMEAIDDEMLLDEITRRKLKAPVVGIDLPIEEGLEEALRLLKRGNASDAELLIERLLYPKFKALADCIARLPKENSASESSS